MIVSALTNPTMTGLGTKRISRPAPSRPSATWTTPVSTVAANRYSTPWSRTRWTITSAIEAVAAEIITGRPPVIATMTAIENDA